MNQPVQPEGIVLGLTTIKYRHTGSRDTALHLHLRSDAGLGAAMTFRQRSRMSHAHFSVGRLRILALSEHIYLRVAPSITALLCPLLRRLCGPESGPPTTAATLRMHTTVQDVRVPATFQQMQRVSAVVNLGRRLNSRNSWVRSEILPCGEPPSECAPRFGLLVKSADPSTAAL